jgi:hypothetical protein
MALQCRPALDIKYRKQSAKMFTKTSSVVNRPMNVVKTWQNAERSMKLLKNYAWLRTAWRPRLLHIFRLFHFVDNLETPHHRGSITTFIIILKTYNACISLATSCHWAEKSTGTFQLSTADMPFNFWIRDKCATSAASTILISHVNVTLGTDKTSRSQHIPKRELLPRFGLTFTKIVVWRLVTWPRYILFNFCKMIFLLTARQGRERKITSHHPEMYCCISPTLSIYGPSVTKMWDENQPE